MSAPAPRRLQAIVLIGTPGSGKTWVGEVLARRLGLEFLDMERMFLARYGSTEAFLADKPAALAWFEQEVRARIAAEERTVIFEIGAFSQRDTARRLQEDFATILVLVRAPAALRRRRIVERESGRHLTEAADETMKHDDVFEKEIQPTFDFAFRVDNEDLTEDGLVRRARDELARSGLAPL